MFNVGGGEILAILVIALIVLGPDKLPNAARQAGKYLNEFRRISSGFQDEIRGAMDLATTSDPTPVKMDPAEPADPGVADETAATGDDPAPDPVSDPSPMSDDAGPAKVAPSADVAEAELAVTRAKLAAAQAELAEAEARLEAARHVAGPTWAEPTWPVRPERRLAARPHRRRRLGSPRLGSCLTRPHHRDDRRHDRAAHPPGGT